MTRISVSILFLFIVTGLAAQEGVQHQTKQFTLNESFTDTSLVVLDTSLYDFHTYKITDKQSPFNQILGNYGLAYMEQDFFLRNFERDDFLYRHYKRFMHHKGNLIFLDTHVPFTEAKWTFAGQRQTAEQTLSVRHSQSVNRYFNFGLDLDIVYALGQYNYQKTDDRAFRLHGSYMGNKYRAFGAWSINNFLNYENGGVTEYDQLEDFDSRDIPVNMGSLNEAQNVLRNMNFQFVHKLILGGGTKTAATDSEQPGNEAADLPRADNEQSDSVRAEQGLSDSVRTEHGPGNSVGAKPQGGVKGTITHIIDLDRNRRYYTDNSPGGGFYDSIYINNSSTFDSLYARILGNTLRFDFTTPETSKFRLGIGVGVRNELNVFSQILPTHEEEVVADTTLENFSSNALLGSLYSRIGRRFGWEADGKLYFTGLKAGDTRVKGKVFWNFGEGDKRSTLTARGGFYLDGPSYWMNNWGSNHYEWTNDFTRQLRIDAGGEYEFPAIKFRASLDNSLISNYLYYNSSAMPAQFDGALSVLTARLSKGFSFWKFRWNNLLMFQQSTNREILDLPMLCAKTTFYFDNEFYFKSTGGRLHTQLGFEGIYHTEYYSYSYMPSTGIFYNQDAITTGNYPMLNVFLNMRLKRTRFFLAFEHVHQGLLGQDYYSTPFYPMNTRMFKYGLAWTFYD